MEWNLPDVQFLQQANATSTVCVCCLAKNVQLINLKTCVHSCLMITLSFGNMIKDKLVCLGCHRMLQKFHKFKLQVEENIKVLNNQKLNNQELINQNENFAHATKMHGLQITYINIYNTPSPEIDSPIDSIKTETTLKFDIEELEENSHDNTITDDYDESVNKKQELSRSEEEKDHIIEIEIPILYVKQELFSTKQDTDLMKPLEHIEYKQNNLLMGRPRGPQKGDQLHKQGTISSKIEQKNKKLRSKSKNIQDSNKNDLSLDQRARIVPTQPISVENLSFECDYCGRKFRWKCSLYRHINRAHVNKPVQCPYCPKMFKNDHSLRPHVLTIHEKKDTEAPVQCPVCLKEFKMKSSLQVHMRQMHRPVSAVPDKEEERFCVECNKLYKSKARYKLHLKTSLTHAADKFECHDCSKKFSVKGSLMVHIQRLHLNAKKHACSVCGKLFYKKYERRNHEQYNHFGVTKERKHACNQCGKAFSSPATLRTHMLVHSGAKDHHCQHCPMKFAQKSTLKTHCKFKHKDAYHLMTTTKNKTNNNKNKQT